LVKYNLNKPHGLRSVGIFIMKLRILKHFNRYSENEIIEASDAEATNLISRGVAEEIKAEKKAPSNKMEKKPKTK